MRDTGVRWIRRTPVVFLAVLAAVGLGGGAAATPRPSPSPMSTPEVERVEWAHLSFGRPPQRVTVARDGTVVEVTEAMARLRTPERRRTGRLAAAEVAGLLAAIEAAGFFALQDSYRDPRLADGVAITVRVVRGGVTKEVLVKNHAGPPALERLLEALDAAAARVAWDAPAPTN